MCDGNHPHEHGPFGYLVDVPEIRALIDETRRCVARWNDPADRVEALKPAFAKLLEAEGWLPDAFAKPDDSSNMGGGIGQYALYRAEDGSLCLFSLVVPAGAATPGNEPLIMVRAASPAYFATLGIPLRMGRDFTESDDTTGVRKVIVNEALVRRLLPGEDPIGRHLLQGSAPQHDEYEIIGVVRDVQQSSLDQPPQPEAYTPYADLRVDWAVGDVSLVVKSAMPEETLVPQVRQAVHDVARDVALTQIQPMTDVIENSLANRKLTLTLFGIFAGVALLLAASGLYGVIYYLVTQRTREIGIRVALGARTSRVVAMVLAQGGTLVGIGILLGVAGALGLSRLLDSLLFGVGARDPLTFVSVPIVLAVVALLATMVPAWKAAHVDPVIALREE
jgi:predicted permease